MTNELPRQGMPVFSNDGSHLGHVDGVSAGAGWFKVNAPQAPDYWLPLSVILDPGSRYVLLSIRKSELREVRFEGPEPELPSLSALGSDRDLDAGDRSRPLRASSPSAGAG